MRCWPTLDAGPGPSGRGPRRPGRARWSRPTRAVLGRLRPGSHDRRARESMKELVIAEAMGGGRPPPAAAHAGRGRLHRPRPGHGRPAPAGRRPSHRSGRELEDRSQRSGHRHGHAPLGRGAGPPPPGRRAARVARLVLGQVGSPARGAWRPVSSIASVPAGELLDEARPRPCSWPSCALVRSAGTKVRARARAGRPDAGRHRGGPGQHHRPPAELTREEPGST